MNKSVKNGPILSVIFANLIDVLEKISSYWLFQNYFNSFTYHTIYAYKMQI